MILDKFESREKYINLNPLFARAFTFIEEYLQAPKEKGVYEIVGRDLFAIVQNYPTKESGLYEAHNKYIDIQYMVEGTEKVYCKSRDGLNIIQEYDDKKDVLLLDDDAYSQGTTFVKNQFAIFFPEDAHKPGMKNENIESVRKIVIKVKI